MKLVASWSKQTQFLMFSLKKKLKNCLLNESTVLNSMQLNLNKKVKNTCSLKEISMIL